MCKIMGREMMTVCIKLLQTILVERTNNQTIISQETENYEASTSDV